MSNVIQGLFRSKAKDERDAHIQQIHERMQMWLVDCDHRLGPHETRSILAHYAALHDQRMSKRGL